MYVSAIKNWRKLALAVIGGAAFVVGGCDPGGQSSTFNSCNSEPPEINAKRQANFDSSLRRVILTPGYRCIECHDGKSKRGPFAHSSSDLSQAYNAVLGLVELNDPAGSPIVAKIEKSHNCGSAAECQVMATSMISAIQAWAEAETSLPPAPQCNKSLKSGLTLTLEGKPAKPGVLTSTPTSFRWDLTELSSELQGKVNFSVDVTHFVDPSPGSLGTYKISNPVLATDTQRLEVLSVIPTVGGKVTKYANYAGLNFVVGQMAFDVSASIWGFRPLSGSQTVLDYVDPIGGDSLGFQLLVRDATDELPSLTTTQPGCKSTAKFQQVYDNVLNLKVLIDGQYVGQCTRCHGDPTQAANAVMDLSYNGSDACLQVLTRVNLATPYSSLLLTKPSRADSTGCQGTGHPVEFRFLSNCGGTAADPNHSAGLSAIVNWINDEASQQ